jgi:arginase family enzyme
MDVCDPSIAGRQDASERRLRLPRSPRSWSWSPTQGQLVALDSVEVNPTLDIRNTTAEFGAELALSALGKGIL